MIRVDEDGTTLRLTRGDGTLEEYNRLAFCFPIWDFENEEEVKYEFQPEDEITFIVYDKKGYTKVEILKRVFKISDLGYTEGTTTPELLLAKQDTEKFELLDKPKTYWYNLILNGDTTIIGSDEDGAKKLIVYPGGTEGGADVPE